MNAERWEQVHVLFDAAVGLASAERGAFLDRACSGSLELRNEVAGLLSEYDAATCERFLELSFPATLDPESPPALADHPRYHVIRKLGEGGMGSVWLVRHRELNIERAIKLIVPSLATDPQVRARFMREARITAGLVHPNAVTVHDAQITEDSAFIEMEYVRGRSLDKLLKPGVPMSLDWVGNPLKQLCAVLQAAHEKGIVHRDIKPSNLLLVDGDPAGRELLKVLDFGIAKIRGADLKDLDDVRTKTGSFLGTAHYSSPEQARGGDVDGRSDLYSVGVLLYELLTGFRPFSGNFQMLLYKHGTEAPPPFAARNSNIEVPSEIEQVVLGCMAKDPADRPQSARELARTFLHAGSRSSTAAPAYREPEKLPQIGHEPPPRPSKVDPGFVPALDTLSLKAQAKAPTDRYTSTADYAEALDRHLEPPSNELPDPPCLGPPPRRAVARAGPRLAVVVASLAIAITIAALHRDWWSRVPPTEKRPGGQERPPRLPPLGPALGQGAAPPGPGPDRAGGGRPPGPAAPRAVGPQDPLGPVPDPHSFARKIGLELVSIPGNEGVRSWLLGKTEVTRGQFRTILGRDPSCSKDAGEVDRMPVDNVSWFDAVELCNELSQRDGRAPYYKISGEEADRTVVVPDPDGDGFRLPTVGEWEMACSLGEHALSSKAVREARFWDLSAAAAGPRPAGQGEANEFGLSDMLGNVWEWCWDPGPGETRGLRGGAYDNPPPRNPSEIQSAIDPARCSCSYGFRVARHLGRPARAEPPR